MFGRLGVCVVWTGLIAGNFLPETVLAADDPCLGNVCEEFKVYGPTPSINKFTNCFTQRYKNSYDGASCKLSSEEVSKLGTVCTSFSAAAVPKTARPGSKALAFVCVRSEQSYQEAGALYFLSDTKEHGQDDRLLMDAAHAVRCGKVGNLVCLESSCNGKAGCYHAGWGCVEQHECQQ